MDNIKELTFTYIDEDSKEHTVKLNNFVNVKDSDLSIITNESREYGYKDHSYCLLSKTKGDIKINLSLKCDNFELEEV